MAKMTTAEKGRLARVRSKAADLIQSRQHTLIAVGAAYGVGWAEKVNEDTGKPNMELPGPKGIDPKLVYGVGALLIAGMARQKQVKAASQSVADGLLSIAAYEFGKEGKDVLFSDTDED